MKKLKREQSEKMDQNTVLDYVPDIKPVISSEEFLCLKTHVLGKDKYWVPDKMVTFFKFGTEIVAYHSYTPPQGGTNPEWLTIPRSFSEDLFSLVYKEIQKEGSDRMREVIKAKPYAQREFYDYEKNLFSEIRLLREKLTETFSDLGIGKN